MPYLFEEKSNQRFVYTDYVLTTSQKVEVLSQAKKANIHLNETWPAEGHYWEGQNTKNIEKIKQEMLLLSVSPYWSEKEIQSVERFLDHNKGLFKHG